MLIYGQLYGADSPVWYGFPFFAPVFRKDCSLAIYAGT